MNHPEEAKRLFLEGYNCAQAVFCAYRDVTGLDLDTSARLASSFGAGMGRLREVCGAVSGALMVLGYVRGYDGPNDQDTKAAQYALVQQFAGLFREHNGSIICRDLLKDIPFTNDSKPEARTSEFYSVRPCPHLTEDAASILDGLLFNQTEK